MDRVTRTCGGILRIALAAALAMTISSCGWFGGDDKDVRRKQTLASEQITSIGVNAYLWQATLETLDFMPMADVDSDGGVIITDWYINPSNPYERSKVSVYILDKSLRADALKVHVFRQQLTAGEWRDDPQTEESAANVAEAILVQARRIRLGQVPEKR